MLDGRNPDMADKNKNGYFVGPTIFTDVTPDMTIVKEEIFGPVLAVISASSLADAIEIANDTVGGQRRKHQAR